MKTLILLVNDNEDILIFLKNELHKIYEIVAANDGNEALEVLSEIPVQLIVSDIMMDGMDGLELCKAVKKILSTAISH